MDKQTAFIIPFTELTLSDVPLVGGKNAALGEMIGGLKEKGIYVPEGFAVTAYAYRYLLRESGLEEKIKSVLDGLDTRNIRDLSKRGSNVRKLILKATLPKDLEVSIRNAYREMSEKYNEDIDVAVRSSATAEDLPGASFAGQQETYLHIKGEKMVLEAVRKCFASLFTDRAISYRTDKGFSHFDVALSVGVQRMVRTDIGSSGVAFTTDTETGFDKVIVINSAYGLGEYVVQGKVTPDEFVVFQPFIGKVSNPIISKTLAQKDIKMVYSGNRTKKVKVSEKDRNRFSISDEDVIKLASWCSELESFFSEKYHHHQPMDIEWGKDGKTGELAILQARPETIHSVDHKFIKYSLKETSVVLTSGASVGSKIATGRARVIMDVKGIHSFKQGEILVTDVTDPDWEPIMKIASAIITDKGGRTSHAAIVSRELGIPCIVGTENATKVLKTGDEITVDCASGTTGFVYRGILPFDEDVEKISEIPEISTKVMLNIGAPDEAFRHWRLPVKGVGLGRLEFIIASHIQIHPRALLEYEKLKKDKGNKRLISKIDELTKGYVQKTDYYVDKLTEGIAKIAATFYPHDVIIRFSDFKTNEYRTLLGGKLFEPQEENPMIGWRGASRYYHPEFKKAFCLEVQAMLKVRQERGFTNVIPMIPFCRTPKEVQKVLSVMQECGFDREQDSSLKVYMMCEVPSNIVLAEEFLDVVDGYSIGSNDLTQLVLGLDRDSARIADISNENDQAVKKVIKDVVAKVKDRNKYIGICGQAPSDYEDFASFLVDIGIDSMSLSPDTVIKTIKMISEIDKTTT